MRETIKTTTITCDGCGTRIQYTTDPTVRQPLGWTFIKIEVEPSPLQHDPYDMEADLCPDCSTKALRLFGEPDEAEQDDEDRMDPT